MKYLGVNPTSIYQEGKTKKVLLSRFLLFGLLMLLQTTSAVADAIIGNYELMKKQRLSFTEFQYTYTGQITNTGNNDLTNVTATVSTTSTSITIVDNSLSFGDVPAGNTAKSSDTFAIKYNRTVGPLNLADLVWSIQSGDSTTEVEFNDNPTDATPTNTIYPLTVTGAIQADIDGDYFRFSGTQGDIITAAMIKTASDFKPILSMANQAGVSLQGISVNVSENSLFSTTFTALLPSDGDYFLIINDANSKGNPSFTYTVHLFKDRDLDGLPDDIESTVGLDNQSPDSDGDGIFDASEVNGEQDIDGDGQPNWLDLDSDGDTIPDQLEGSADVDGDTLGNFIDTDSDGNGVSDTEEAGPNPNDPHDSDVDGIPDYLDNDDDNDGILDVNDTDRLARVKQSNALDFDNRVYLEVAVVDFGNGNILEDAARTGETLVLKGDGFSATAADNLVIFKGNNGSINVSPTAATETELRVIVPEGAGSRISVVTNNQRSNGLDVQIFAENTPVLFERNAVDKVVRTGETITLTGLNFGSNTNVNFGGIQATAFNVTSNSLDVTVPTDAVSGKVAVINAAGVSNAITIKVTAGFSGRVVLPTSSPVEVTSLIVTFGPLGEVTPDASGNINVQVNNSEMDTVWALLPEVGGEPQAVFLQALTIPGDSFVTLDTLSTAVAMTMTGIGVRNMVNLTEMGEVRTLLSQLPEVIALASTLETALNTEPYFLNKPTSTLQQSYYQALFVAYESAQKAVEEFLSQSTTRRSSLKTPEITSEQYDVKVFQVSDSGNVGVENDTQLYLSAKFIDSNTNETLFKHIDSYFDSNMVGPQGLGLLFRAAKKADYNQPNWRNCQIEVVTPGVLNPSGPISVREYLALRTYIDRVFLPIINQAVGELFSPSDLTNILVNNAGNAVNVFGTLLDNGDVKGALKSIAFVFLDDIRSVPPGPITTAIAKRYGKGLLKKALEKLAKKIASKLIPGIGQISAALEIAGALNTFTNVGKTAKDFGNTPGLLTFDVEWPLQITDVTPDVIKNSEEDILIVLDGQGFARFKKGIIGFRDWVYPEITFTDDGNTAAPVTVVKHELINTAGTIMSTKMPGTFRNAATGPISIKATHDEGTVETISPEKIRVVPTLEITSLDPNAGGSGTTIQITGAGFEVTNFFDNLVTFQGSGGQRINATITSVSETTLKVIAPAGLETGDVQVEVNGEISNGLLFTRLSKEVTFDFGDNGSANDDTFGLFVDGVLIHSMPSPTRNAGPIVLDLEDGQHSVTLRGITAPDDIGTYFIGITGNVLSVTGDPLTGNDLTAGVEKHYTIEVGTTTTRKRSNYMGSVPEGIIWAE